MKKLEVYLEVGKKKVFAGALDWPGWCRSGPDEEAALEALIQYGPRYRRALGTAAGELTPPKSVTELRVVDRLKGNSSTDFGVPGVAPSNDSRPVKPNELERLKKLVRASWKAFDASAKAAGSKTLTKGPRGGGRDVAKMKAHVLDGEGSYLQGLGGQYPKQADLKKVRNAFLKALSARARGELPDVGPRGGQRWHPRYAVRRSAWHSLDHAWEIEDRASG